MYFLATFPGRGNILGNTLQGFLGIARSGEALPLIALLGRTVGGGVLPLDIHLTAPA